MKFIIYGTPSCSFCVQAKNLCEQKGANYTYESINSKEEMEALQEKIGRPVRTVPQVFMMSEGFAEYIGGYDELLKRLS